MMISRGCTVQSEKLSGIFVLVLLMNPVVVVYILLIIELSTYLHISFVRVARRLRTLR